MITTERRLGMGHDHTLFFSFCQLRFALERAIPKSICYWNVSVPFRIIKASKGFNWSAKENPIQNVLLIAGLKIYFLKFSIKVWQGKIPGKLLLWLKHWMYCLVDTKYQLWRLHIYRCSLLHKIKIETALLNSVFESMCIKVTQLVSRGRAFTLSFV